MTPERWARLKEVFGAAFELPPDQRALFLESACGGDMELHVEVERLLAGSDNPSWQSALSRAIAAGDTIAQFRIDALLGEGGMGMVYRAYDTKLGRTVALKVLPPELSSDLGQKQKLLREARAASGLTHPNIVTVYEVGSENGVDFISMEYVEGSPLTQVIRRSPLAFRQALGYAIEIADALVRAHSAGVIHRDLKPANIMVTEDGRIKLLDFGLARHSRSVDGATVSLTNVGEIAGTPFYMSPEQARGRKVDARTDIFSFGVVLYEMIAGRRPFEGDTASHAMMCIVEKEPLPLPAGTPPEAVRIVGKMIEKDPARRYQSAKDLAVDLRKLQEASPVAGRRRKTVTISLTIVALAAFALFLYWWDKPGLTAKDTILLADFVNTTGDTVFDDTLKQGLAAQLEQSPYLSLLTDAEIQETLRYMGRRSGERITGEIGREICQRRGSKALIEGTIAPLGSHYAITLQAVNAGTSGSIGRVQTEADSKEHVLRALGDAGTQLRRKLGESLSSIARYDAPLIQATTSSLEALQAYSMAEQRSRAGDNAGALRYRKRAVELDPNFALAYKSLSVAYRLAGERSALFVAAATKAFDLRSRATELERFIIEGNYYHYVQADLDKAIESLDLATQSYPRSYQAWNNLSAAYSVTGQDEKALAAARQALPVPSVVQVDQIAQILFRLSRLAEIKDFCKVDTGRRSESQYCHLYLFEIAASEGNEAEQQRQLQWAEAHNPEQADNFRLGMAESEGRIGQVAESMGRDAEAARRDRTTAANRLKRLALDDAVTGECSQAGKYSRAAMDVSHGPGVLIGAGLAAALCKDSAGVMEATIAGLDSSLAVNPALSACLRVLVNASSSLEEGAPYRYPLRAKNRNRFELAYCRGQVFLARRDGTSAAVEFQYIINHRGVDPLSILYPAAYVGMARAEALTGDLAKSRKAYEDFLTLWKRADKDLPVIAEAQREVRRLQ